MTLRSPQIRSIPTHEILEGLSRLHPFVLLADRDGRIEWMSSRLQDRLRKKGPEAACAASGEDRIGRLLAQLPERRQLEALCADLHADGGAGSVRLDIGTAHGTRIRVEASAFTVEVDTPNDPHYVVIARPEGEGEQNARELSGAVDLLSQIVDRSPNGVLATDRSGYITYANPRAAEFLGHAAEDLVGRPVAIFLPRSTGFEDLLERLRHPMGWDGEEMERIDARGHSTRVSISTRPLLGSEGRPAGVITYLRDVTRRHQVQRELERKNLELESYVDSVAHDLRSPLVSLLGFTHLLKQDYEDVLDEQGNHFLDRVEQAGRTMDALIHDLLELTRIRRAGEIRALLDPRSVLLQVEAELKLRMEEHGVAVTLPSDPPMMRVDATHLYQVFSNLIGNALCHGFGGERGTSAPPRIEIEIREQEAGDEIVVSDNGCGIAPEDQERIFEVFRTGRGVRRGERSHGIGLAIVKKIAEAHDGRVWVESRPGEGASFHVLFPHE